MAAGQGRGCGSVELHPGLSVAEEGTLSLSVLLGRWFVAGLGALWWASEVAGHSVQSVKNQTVHLCARLRKRYRDIKKKRMAEGSNPFNPP